MKLIAALLISASAVLGFTVPAMAGVTLTTPGNCVDLQDAAVGGAVTAVTNVDSHTDAPPLVIDFDDTCS